MAICGGNFTSVSFKVASYVHAAGVRVNVPANRGGQASCIATSGDGYLLAGVQQEAGEGFPS